MTTYRSKRDWLPGVWWSRGLTTATIGAFFGLLPWIDARMVGPDYYASVQDLPPLEGFAWNVGGTAALFAIGWLIYELVAWRDRVRHARRAADYRARKAAEANDPRNWTPERRRQALRTIQGGKA